MSTSSSSSTPHASTERITHRVYKRSHPSTIDSTLPARKRSKEEKKRRRKRRSRATPVVTTTNTENSRCCSRRSSFSVDPDAADAMSSTEHSSTSKSHGVDNTRNRKDKPDRMSPHASTPESSSTQLAKLTADLADKEALLDRHQTLLQSIQLSLTCQICLELMHKPYALSPCGHLACYSCLSNWFTINSSGNDTPLSTIRKAKTCPHCRALIKDRPVEIWGLKTIIGSVCKSGLLPNITEPIVSPNVDIDATANADPWAGVFPRPGPIEPLWDEMDRVYRCIQCHHEIWGGRCSGCDREYPNLRVIDGAASQSDDDDEVMGIFGGQGEDDFDDDEDEEDEDDIRAVHFSEQDVWRRRGSFDDSEGYESSFIDDVDENDVDDPQPEVFSIRDTESTGYEDNDQMAESGHPGVHASPLRDDTPTRMFEPSSDEDDIQSVVFEGYAQYEGMGFDSEDDDTLDSHWSPAAYDSPREDDSHSEDGFHSFLRSESVVVRRTRTDAYGRLVTETWTGFGFQQ